MSEAMLITIVMFSSHHEDVSFIDHIIHMNHIIRIRIVGSKFEETRERSWRIRKIALFQIDEFILYHIITL